MESRKLSFTTAGGATLAARLDLPVAEPVACALFAHCFTCSKNLTSSVRVSRALAELGIAVLRFDFTGHGESEGEFEDANFTSNVEDLLAAAEALTAEYEPPQLLIGHSLGGTAMLHAAARMPSARAVATINAPFDPAHATRLFAGHRAEIDREGEAEVEIEGRRYTITKQLVRDLESVSTKEVLRGLRVATLVLHAPHDELVEIENARRLFLAARHPKSFISLDRADHLLSDPADAEYAGRLIVAWAQRYLSSRAPTVPERTEAGASVEDAEEGEVLVRLEGAPYRAEITASGHALVADEPVRLGGGDDGPTPYDLLVSALGACTAMTLRMYADRKEWPVESISVRLRHLRAHATDERFLGAPEARLDRIESLVSVTGPLDAGQRARLLEIAAKCPVHRTLSAGVDIASEVAEAGEPHASESS